MNTGTNLKRQFSYSGLFVALTCLLSAPAVAQNSKDWVDIKDPNELKALYSNTTFRGKTPTGEAFTAYNRSDGLRQIVIPQWDGIQKWRVNGSEVCSQNNDGSQPEMCYTILKHATRKGEYQSRRVKDGAITTFKVELGIKAARTF
jgi:hypothetical protein